MEMDAYVKGDLGHVVAGLEQVGAGADVEMSLSLNLGQAVLEALVKEANDVLVLGAGLVSVGISVQAVQVSTGQLLERWLHSSRQCGIRSLQVALPLMCCLDARVVVDLCAASAASSILASGSGCAAPSSTPSGAATTSLGRARLVKSSVTHGGVAIQRRRVKRKGEKRREGWCVEEAD